MRISPLFKVILTSLIFILAFNKVALASEVELKTLNLPVKLVSGETLKLAEFKNSKPVYIKFWASWCTECMKQMPHLEKAYKKYGNKVQFIAVNIGVNDDLQTVNAVKNKFGLTMPLAIDQSGELAKAFNLMATPLHILINQQGEVIYTEYVKTEGIDKRLAMLSTGKSFAAKNPVVEKNGDTAATENFTNKPTALFFVATWCDWYLKETRPEVSKNCIDAQKKVNELYTKYPDINWVGVATRLWTGDAELTEYKKKFNVKNKMIIDTSNNITFKYGVKDYPTLILLNGGKEVFRTQSLKVDEVSTQLAKLSAK